MASPAPNQAGSNSHMMGNSLHNMLGLNRPTSSSPPGKKSKPDLTLLIPNAPADPPGTQAPNSLGIHVLKVSFPMPLSYNNGGLGLLRAKFGGFTVEVCDFTLHNARRGVPQAAAEHGMTTAMPVVPQDLLSPVELQYVSELNDMDIPLQVC